MYQYRRALDRDIPFLVALRLELFRTVVDEKEWDWDDVTRTQTSWFSEAMKDGRVVAWVAETGDGRIVAASALSFYELPPKPWNPTGLYAYVSTMFTVPDHRRRGLGGRLLQAALDYAAEKGVPNIMLHASPAGRPLYESFGFTAGNEMKMKID